MHSIAIGVTSAALLLCSFGVAGGQAKNGDKDSSRPAFKVLNGSRANPRITLTELLESYEKAVGGKKAIERIRTVVAYAERSAQTKPGAPRFGSSVEYFNFSNNAKNFLVWHDGPNEGIQKMPREMNMFALQESNLFGFLHLRAAFPQMMLAGSSKLEDRDVYVVDAPLGSVGLYRRLFFDAETRLLIGSVVIQVAADRILISERFYSDFRVVNGVKFPFAMRAFEYTSQSSLEIRMTRIECNIPPPDDFFPVNSMTAEKSGF